jgi:hypothetical protein
MTEQKNITLINLKPPFNLQPHVLKLASPQRTKSIVQVLVCETELKVIDLETEQTEARPIETHVFEEIFEASHTIIIPDAMFSKASKVFHTELFVDKALKVLEKFYREREGTVIIMCFEGIYGIGSLINPIFDTKWQVKFFETCTAERTARGIKFLGPYAPKTPELKECPYFVDAPDEEGLYARLLADREAFISGFHAEDETFERLGITPTDGMDCFDAEKSWENYMRRYTGRYVICLHEGKASTEGNVVWYGDRGQSEGMSFVFCKFLNLGSSARGLLDERQSTESEANVVVHKPQMITSMTTIVSMLVILAALLAKYMGYSYE